MKKLLIATKNPGKVREFTSFLPHLQLVSLTDVEIEDDVEEDGETFIENSQKKALFYAKKSGLPALSDDGGLEIAALNGEPGVKSRRWLGYEASDEELREHLRNVIRSLPENKRQAQFTTVVSFALPNGYVWSERGEIKGILSENTQGKDFVGYPYRSFFYIPEIKKFYYETELTHEEIEKVNHRHHALQKLLPVIETHL